MDKKINSEYGIKIAVEILFDKGLINQLTFEEIQKRLQFEKTHNSQNETA